MIENKFINFIIESIKKNTILNRFKLKCYKNNFGVFGVFYN